MTYTSSWGEASGKEVIDDYLERTKEELKGTEQLRLRTTSNWSISPTQGANFIPCIRISHIFSTTY